MNCAFGTISGRRDLSFSGRDSRRDEVPSGGNGARCPRAVPRRIPAGSIREGSEFRKYKAGYTTDRSPDTVRGGYFRVPSGRNRAVRGSCANTAGHTKNRIPAGSRRYTEPWTAPNGFFPRFPESVRKNQCRMSSYALRFPGVEARPACIWRGLHLRYDVSGVRSVPRFSAD